MHLGVLWFLLYNITVAIDTVGVSLNHNYGPSSLTCFLGWAANACPRLVHAKPHVIIFFILSFPISCICNVYYAYRHCFRLYS